MVLGDRKIFVDLQVIVLVIKCKITQANDAYLRARSEAVNRNTIYFVNNTLHSLLPECTVSANIIKISITKVNYAPKDFIETKFFYGQSAKNTWLVCQGFNYEEKPQKVDGAHNRATDVGERKALVVEATFFGKPHVTF